jgi:hypothetical protein
MLFGEWLLWLNDRLVSIIHARRSLCLRIESAVTMDVKVDAHTATEQDHCPCTRSYLELTAVADQHSIMQRVITVDLLADAVH